MVMVLIGLSVFIVCSYVFCVPQVSIYMGYISRLYHTLAIFVAKITMRFQTIGFRGTLFLRQSPPLVGEEMPSVAPSLLQLAPLAQLVLPQELQLGAPGEHQQTK